MTSADDGERATAEDLDAARESEAPDAGGASRRDFLKASAGVMAGGAATRWLPGRPLGQDGDGELGRVQGARRNLLRGGVVLTLDPAVGDFAQADVLIEDGKIREVGPSVAAGDAAVVDAANLIVLPGFVDTHHHFYQGILRNILTNGLLTPDYFRDIQGTLTPAYEPSDVYAGALITALGMIDMGTTLAVDTSQVSHTPEHTDAGIRALQDAGIRAVYAYWRGNGPAVEYPQGIVPLRARHFNSPDQLLTLGMAATLSADNLAEIIGYAREVGANLFSHGVSDATQDRLIEFTRAGLLGAGDEYIHCNHLSSEAWQMLRDSGGRASLSTPIEMAMGHGMPGIQDALDHGVRPSLSSDVDATMAQDPFTIMRATLTLQRLLLLQRARNGEQDLPPLLTCRDVLEFATVEGARAAGLADKVGTLTPGKEADVVLLKADRLNVWPLNNAAGDVVNVMNPSNVDTVFIAGQVRKWRGALVGVDEARVRRLAQEARDAVVRRSGFELDLLG
ncbi:MAG TPA: amidohydrolase family protein [Chloroflexota bacterium]|jgi:cytosine/adenosine deaminase-related metal-dependent hydrolase